VDADRAHDAQSALRSLGFDTHASAGSTHTSQHLAPLYRDGLPGWLELHIATASRRGSDRLPSRELEQLSIRSERDGLSVRLLPAAYDVLHGLAHNHFSHRSSSLGTVNLKGLYEFAAAVNAAKASDHEQIHDRATRDARLLGAFDFWVAAAARFYRFTPPAGWSIAPDADARAVRVLARMARGEMGSMLTIFREEVGLALGRVQRSAKPGQRMRTRANILNSAIREIVVPWRDRADLHRDSAGIRSSR